MRRRSERGILLLAGAFLVMFTVLVWNYMRLAEKRQYVKTAAATSFITVNAGDSQGTVFDRNFVPLTNTDTELIAVAVPTAVTLEELNSIAADKAALAAAYKKGRPFAFRCTAKGEDSAGLTFFELPVNGSGRQLAPHAVGYLSEGKGVSGIEYAYDSVLRGTDSENSVTYSTDGFGSVLIGAEKQVVRSEKQHTGVVTTLDSRIQSICERAGADIGRGAIVVSDVKTGNILALASFPSYDVSDIGAALSDERSPLIDRAMYSYSVGSIFKLVTACEGINEGYGGYIYDCRGSIDVAGQHFRCHKTDGHGEQDMTSAMTNSCNTYFISLSRLLDVPAYRSLAFDLGFGREIHLCAGMTASAGTLPTEQELSIPAELANFSFGQGKLSASPLQINAMTCAIANGGELVMPELIRGITLDGETVGNEKLPRKSRVMTEETAQKLRKMMIAAVYENENSNARPQYIRAGAKTSTAQTGRYDENGEELCHAWITGFFPASAPTYAVTVLAEDGGYGNDAAAPVFADIADGIMNMGAAKKQ